MNTQQQHGYDTNTGQVIALAGIIQSAYLVEHLAKTGKAPIESISPSINSLFEFDAKTPASVYGGIQGVALGLDILKQILTDASPKHYRGVIRYSLGILHLQKKLTADTQMMDIIRSRLKHAELKSAHFTNNINQVSASIAAIYQDTISTFKYRIQITGSMQQLQNTNNANLIRALLLAGIRAGVLWRQTGGHRWHLFFSKRRLLTAVTELLDS